MHETLTQSPECRDFNRRTVLLLEMLEEARVYRLADRVMDLLGCCNPKDFSQCDSVQRARDILERLRLLAKESLKEDKS